MWTTSDPARRPACGRGVGAEPRRQPIGQPAGVDTGWSGQHRLLDQPTVVDGHHVAERRRPAAATDGPQVHERRPVGIEPAGRGVEHDAVGRLPCGGRRRGAHQASATGGVDDESGIDVVARGEAHSAPPREVLDTLGHTSSAFEPGAEVTAQLVAVQHAVRALDDLAVRGVDDDGRCDGAEAGRGQLRHVVDPRGVRRRPGPVGADDDDGRPAVAAFGGQGQPGRTVPDHGDVQLRTGHGQPTRSSAAILRNCSTTSGVRCAGSWER